MAITGAQSTSQILAAQAANNRRQAQQAQLAEPQAVNNAAGTPFGLISAGISNIGNSLTAGDRRGAEQANLDRANAIRLEQQQFSRNAKQEQTNFDRGQKAEQTSYNRSQDTLRNTRQQAAQDSALQSATQKQNQSTTTFENAAIDRAATIAGEHANVALQGELQNIQKGQAIEKVEATKRLGLRPNSPAVQRANDINSYYAAGAAEGGQANAVQRFMNGSTSELAESMGARQNVQDDINYATEEYMKKYPDTDPALLDFAVFDELQNTEISAETWFTDGGDLDASGFLRRLNKKIPKLMKASVLASEFGTIDNRATESAATSQLNAAGASLRTK